MNPILNAKQRNMVKMAIGDGNDFPKITCDPIVNWKVDCIVDEEVPYEADLYEAEVRAWGF